MSTCIGFQQWTTEKNEVQLFVYIAKLGKCLNIAHHKSYSTSLTCIFSSRSTKTTLNLAKCIYI